MNFGILICPFQTLFRQDIGGELERHGPRGDERGDDHRPLQAGEREGSAELEGLRARAQDRGEALAGDEPADDDEGRQQATTDGDCGALVGRRRVLVLLRHWSFVPVCSVAGLRRQFCETLALRSRRPFGRLTLTLASLFSFSFSFSFSFPLFCPPALGFQFPSCWNPR